jgi:Na+-translocating ferredoxin:NAD+ oxidoreductase RnfC subunit
VIVFKMLLIEYLFGVRSERRLVEEVKVGDVVTKGQLIADIPEKSLGAKIHASISGSVTEVTDGYIGIQAR